MKKLLLTNYQAPGDILLLTSAVRDLHKAHGNKFLIGVDTKHMGIWENNPYITKFDENDTDVTEVKCRYTPYYKQADELPYHFIHGFRRFLEDHLKVTIPPSGLTGDIFLTEKEKSEKILKQFGVPNDYWIVMAGGKTDFTTKWWDQKRYQEVVDHFKGRIHFVQCGDADHHHPPLKNATNLVGKTSIRDFVVLMHHASGVICPITFAMHLAAAVETKAGRPKKRPCVVIAGGREDAHWEAYSNHQYLHTVGALKCCETSGCYKSRVVKLNDGLHHDESICKKPVEIRRNHFLPKCMDMITSRNVIEAVERYLVYPG